MKKFFGMAALTAVVLLGTSRSLAFEFVIAANDLIQFTEQSFMQNVFGNQRTYTAAKKNCARSLPPTEMKSAV